MSKELKAAEIARVAGPRASNANAPASGGQTDQHETSAAEESDSGALCQLDSSGCELVKRLRGPSLSSPLFKRIAEIAVREPNLLATRLSESGVEPRLALAIAAVLMRERKDPPACCKVCRATAACTPTARARERSWSVLGGVGSAGISGGGSYGCAFSESQTGQGESAMANPANPASQLRDLRDSIDNIDAAIVHMLAERFQCTQAVGKLKAQHGLPSRDPGREAEQVSRLRHLATVSNLDPDFAEKFLSFVIHEVVRQHETVRWNTKADAAARGDPNFRVTG